LHGKCTILKTAVVLKHDYKKGKEGNRKLQKWLNEEIHN
jgi:hypothetical protein